MNGTRRQPGSRPRPGDRLDRAVPVNAARVARQNAVLAGTRAGRDGDPPVAPAAVRGPRPRPAGAVPGSRAGIWYRGAPSAQPLAQRVARPGTAAGTAGARPARTRAGHPPADLLVGRICHPARCREPARAGSPAGRPPRVRDASRASLAGRQHAGPAALPPANRTRARPAGPAVPGADPGGRPGAVHAGCPRAGRSEDRNENLPADPAVPRAGPRGTRCAGLPWPHHADPSGPPPAGQTGVLPADRPGGATADPAGDRHAGRIWHRPGPPLRRCGPGRDAGPARASPPARTCCPARAGRPAWLCFPAGACCRARPGARAGRRASAGVLPRRTGHRASCRRASRRASHPHPGPAGGPAARPVATRRPGPARRAGDRERRAEPGRDGPGPGTPMDLRLACSPLLGDPPQWNRNHYIMRHRSNTPPPGPQCSPRGRPPT